MVSGAATSVSAVAMRSGVLFLGGPQGGVPRSGHLARLHVHGWPGTARADWLTVWTSIRQLSQEA